MLRYDAGSHNAIARSIELHAPRALPDPVQDTQLSGLEGFSFQGKNFINVGERCNVTGRPGSNG